MYVLLEAVAARHRFLISPLAERLVPRDAPLFTYSRMVGNSEVILPGFADRVLRRSARAASTNECAIHVN